MKKHLFITGHPGCGKTDLLREELGAAAAYAGGFLTVPECDGAGKLLTCSLFPASALVGTEGYDGQIFLDCREEAPLHDNEVFRTEGVRLLRESSYYPFTVLDCFGGFDLLVPQYREALTEVLNNDRPVIGVFMDKKGADALKALLGLSDRFTMITDNMRKVLAADPDTEVVTMHGKNDFLARRAVRRWVSEFVR